MAVTVSEGSSFVNISVTKSGSSVLESRVRLSTMDDTATGEYVSCIDFLRSFYFTVEGATKLKFAPFCSS